MKLPVCDSLLAEAVSRW